MPGRHERAHRVDDLGATAVVERDGERHRAVAGGERERLVHPTDQPLGHAPVAPTDEPHAHAAIVELVAPAHEDRLVELHEEAHLVGRAPPVLGGEGVDREPLDAEVERPLDGVEQRLLARRVPFGAGQAPLLGPAPVAVHHAPDMDGDASRVDLVDRQGHQVEVTASAGTVLAVLEKLRPLGERWPWFGTALRVQERMGELNGNQLAASVTLSAFLALFPLLLVAIAVVGFVSSNDPNLANDLVENLGLTGEAATTMKDAITAAETEPQGGVGHRLRRAAVVGPRPGGRAAVRVQRDLAGEGARPARQADRPRVARRRVRDLRRVVRHHDASQLPSRASSRRSASSSDWR